MVSVGIRFDDLRLFGEDGKRLRGPEKAAARKRALTARARGDLEAWLANPAGTALSAE